ncbi:MAG: SpoIIE family protein phosphatase [Spirulina sp. SIO3F2]|nr:SpoIIE family protein phosphatase [Spirulina sp. SIO3F2]
MRSWLSALSNLLQFPLQWVLIIPFLLQIFGAVGLVGYLSFQSGREAVESLAIEVINQTNEVVAEHLNSYLGSPLKLTQMNADAIERGVLDVSNHAMTSHYLWDQMQAYDLTYLGMGFVDGSGYGVARFDGKTTTLEDWTGESENNIVTYTVDDQGNPTDVLGVWTWNNFTETWYTKPIEAGKPIWSIVETYLEVGDFVVFASASRPIYDSQGELLGMLAADVQLLKLSNFLENLHISQSGSVFIVEQDGRLIANSGNSAPFVVKPDRTTERLPARFSSDPLVKQVGQIIQRQQGGFQDLNQSTDFFIELEDESYFVSIRPWQSPYDIDWLVGVVVPKNEFLAEINANRRNTIALCVLALSVATGLGILTTRWIVQPILRLNQASTDMAAGNLAQVVAGSTIQELNGLTTSFNYMANQLGESFAALEANKVQLEERVTQRTTELAIAYEEITKLNQRLQAENLRMSAELTVAKQVQEMILPRPDELKAIPTLDIAGYMNPADEVGGDYYDVLVQDEIVTIGIGDVTGHGIESGLVMMMTQTAIRTLAKLRETDPVRFLNTVNATLYRNVQRMRVDRNLTLAVLNYTDGHLTVMGQHEMVLVVRANGELEKIDTLDLGMTIGLIDDIADFIAQTAVQLEPGDGVVLYTDGITEAKNNNGEFYGLERLCMVIQRYWSLDAQGIQTQVITDIRRFIGLRKVADDITLLILKQR